LITRQRSHALLKRSIVAQAFLIASILGLSGCNSGSSSSDGTSAGAPDANFGCSGNCTNLSATADDVARMIRQGVQEAQAQGVAATIAIVDRVGNVLAVYQMSGAAGSVLIDGQIGAVGGLEGAEVPSTLAAISKAGTGAYLSSQGNAFSTRTAGQIVQENFNPGEDRQPGGPLFGVQFSQTICSDVTVLDGSSIGPRPLPLGLSADPGGIPLYKNGDVIGGIGIEVNGLYSFDRVITDTDDDLEERIALAASVGFEAPSERTAERVFVAGKSLRYTDITYTDLETRGTALPDIDPAQLVAVAGFSDGTIRGGATFGELSSGIAKTTRAGLPAAVLVNAQGGERFPARSGTGLSGAELRADEVSALLDSALLTAYRARAAIRQPLDSEARVSIWVVDHLGNPLGFVRSEDAPLFGIDVSLQKARSATFLSSSDAGVILAQAGFGGYVQNAQALLGPNVLSGSFAIAERSIGNLSRPFFPDGIETNSPGPFSLPLPGSAAAAGATRTWSPFNTGLQLDLLLNSLVAPLQGIIPDDCAPAVNGRLRNGLQVFPGGVPLYRGGQLIGGIGVSGDGIDQDDMVAFFGASRVGLDAAGHSGMGDPSLGFNAPR
jgi:uncharacterized protein GlcG (DUF336 family)